MSARWIESIFDFFYIIHIDNIKGILESGILSHNEVASKCIDRNDISMSDVQERRKANAKFSAFVGDGRNLHDFANLYLNPTNAMIGNLIFSRGLKDKIAILKISAQPLLAQSGWVVSDGNAASGATNFYAKDQLSDDIMREIVRGTKRDTAESPEENKRRKMAEFLYPKSIPPECISSITCISASVQSGINDIVKSLGQSKQVIIDSNMFYRYGRADNSAGAQRTYGKVGIYIGDAFSVGYADAIVVSTNSQGVMATPRKILQGIGGVAGTYRLKCPRGYLEYRRLCMQGEIPLGHPYILDFQAFLGIKDIDRCEDNDLSCRFHIFFPTKKNAHYQEKSKLENVEKGLIKLTEKLVNYPIKSISMPAIACGLGKLDFATQVAPLIIYYANRFVNSNGEKVFTYLFAPQEESKGGGVELTRKLNRERVERYVSQKPPSIFDSNS
tara:strand:+ start:532 stop:1863 length:1332 start_codon:yes stop_codon:yes gene_type:complete